MAQIRAAFGEFISEQGLRNIEKELESPSNALPPLSRETIGYAIFQVRGATLEEVQSNLAQALDTAFDHEVVVEVILSSIVVVTFNATPDTHGRSVAALREKLGSDVRAIHGYGEYPRGGYGSQRRFTYGTIFPDIGAKLEALLKLEFGTWKEV